MKTYPVFLAALVAVPVSSLPALAQDAPTSLNLTAAVTPESAPPGSQLAFELTVTNPGDAPATFTVGDCPVRYRIDGRYSPRWSCGKATHAIRLGPGGSTRFDADAFPGLRFDPRAYPLEPGPHRVILAVEGLGGAEAAFTVQEPSPGTAAVAGRVLLIEGLPATEGTVVLTPLTDAAVALEPGESDDASRTTVSDQGYFLLTDVTPGEYLLRGVTEGGAVWYPGVGDALAAQRLDLEPGTYRGDIQLTYSPDAPPGHVLSGRVSERARFLPGRPLADAFVLAVPDAGKPQAATTDADGRFQHEVPAGRYRLLAGRLVKNRYRYWDGQSTLAQADPFTVPSAASDPARFRIELAPLGNAPVAVLAGRVVAFDPHAQRPPRPLTGARVVAEPLILSRDAAAAPVRGETGEDGAFTLEVPPDTPYRLRVEAEGYAPVVYPETRRDEDGAWIDVEPGGRRGRLNLTLVPRIPASAQGVVEGTVLRRLSPQECKERKQATCLAPVAGAVVRATPAFATAAPFGRRTRTGLDGTFRLTGLPSGPGADGDYLLSVTVEGGDPVYYPEGVPLSRALPLRTQPGKTVSAGRILVNDLPAAGGRLEGTVTDAEGNAVEGALVRVRGSWEDDARRARTRRDGSFAVRGLPEGEPVRISAEAEGWIPGYYPDVCGWTRAEVVIVPDAGVTAPPLHIVLRPGDASGSLSLPGRIVALGGAGGDDAPHPLAGAFLFAYPAGGPVSPAPVAGTVCAENGAALLTGLPEGAYFLMADCPGFTAAYFAREGQDRPSPVLLSKGDPGAVAVIRLAPVAPGDSPGADLGPYLVTRVANVPNPFRPQTSIQYALGESTPVTVQVFDYRGRLVRTLVSGDLQGPGPRQVLWDGRDDGGQRVSSGVYFYRILAGTEAVARKMVLLP